MRAPHFPHARSICFVILMLGLPCSSLTASETSPLPDGLYAEFVTPRGNFVCELFYRKTPRTVTSFTGLAEGKLGPEPHKPFFDTLTFHRVVPNFVVQGGDPQGDGEGGPGYEFPDEFSPTLRHDDIGILSMANDGPDTNGSQFFLTLRPVNRLNYLHSVFGRTVRGRDILPEIKQGDAITAVHILRIGKAATAFHNDQAAFERLRSTAHLYKASRAPGPQANFDDPDHLLPTDPPRARHFNFKLANFERATGIKIVARLSATFTPQTPAQRPGTFTGKLAHQLNLPANSVLVTYFADIDRWGLWFGDTHLNELMGREGTVHDFMENSALHQAKQDLINTALAQAKIFTTEANARATPEHPVTQSDKIKYATDAMLDTLIMRLEPKPQ